MKMRGPKIGTRRTSKYIGRRYDGWTVIEQERYTPTNEATHTHYNYYLSKIDLTTKKIYTIYLSAPTILKLEKQQTTMATLLKNKQWLAEVKHRYIERNKIHKVPLTSTLYN